MEGDPYLQLNEEELMRLHLRSMTEDQMLEPARLEELPEDFQEIEAGVAGDHST